MITPSNIAAIQGSGAANAPQSQSPGQTPQGLLGFFDAIIQQIHATQQGGGALPSGQNLPQGLKGLTAEIAALLKKGGVTQDQLQSMSPQDLAAKITSLMQQQNITIPPALQNMSQGDLATQLASMLQQNNTANSGVKSSLTSDLIAQQSSNVQDTETNEQNVQANGQNAQPIPTKDDIAKKISSFLEQQQQNGGTSALSPAQLSQLKAQIAQLQTAPGTLSPDTLSQLTTDMSSFLTGQGVSQTTIASFLSDLAQTLQKDPSSPAGNAAATTSAATTTAVAAAVQPVVQQPQTDASSASQPDNSPAASQIGDTANPYKGIQSPGDKTPILGNEAPQQAAGGTPTQSSSSAAAGQQQQSLLPQQSLTGRIAGFSVNPALISELAGSDSGSGTGDGFGSQNNNAQQSQDPTNPSALLQPLSADMLNTQNFTNYMNTSSSAQPSPTTQMVTIQIQNNVSNGINTMNLQLEPAELGKMNVRLSFAKDGTVKAHMTVDKPETLALLQKDSSHLQRALQQSGLTTDENSLSFDLKQQGQQQNMNGYNNNGGHADEFSSHMDGDDISKAHMAQLAIQSNGYITRSGVNIMV